MIKGTLLGDEEMSCNEENKASVIEALDILVMTLSSLVSSSLICKIQL